MKTYRCFMIGLLAVTASWVHAQDRGLGVGVIVGEPTGVSVKSWMTPRTALDGAFAWAFDPNTSFHIHANYLVHVYDVVKVDSGRLPLYYGLGGRVKFDDEKRGRNRDSHTRTGVRFPLGMNYHFEGAPVDLFLEVVPILDLAPKSDVSLNAALGARFFFR